MIYILIGIAVAAAFLYFQAQKKKNAQNDNAPQQDSMKTSYRTLKELRSGAVIQLQNYGLEGKDVDVEVTSVNTYDEDGYHWFELQCDAGDQTIWVEVDNDDELFIYATVQKLKLRDINFSVEQLHGLKKSSETEIEHEGITFYFEEKGKAKFFKEGIGEGQKFKYWEFEDEDERYSLSFEEWSDETVDVFFSQRLRAHQIQIFRKNGEN